MNRREVIKNSLVGGLSLATHGITTATKPEGDDVYGDLVLEPIKHYRFPKDCGVYEHTGVDGYVQYVSFDSSDIKLPKCGASEILEVYTDI